jgi:hypothetical protein
MSPMYFFVSRPVAPAEWSIHLPWATVRETNLAATS